MKSAFKSVALDEVRLLKSIMSCDPDDPGHRKIIYMTKFFTESSLNGLHACMTFEIMGPSLLELIIQSEYKGIQIDGVRTIIKQVRISKTECVMRNNGVFYRFCKGSCICTQNAK